ncbi:MAG: tRNA (N(6)-L-threonylcarbamoyladenosine(37)-C(2))-methylthiotransferase MtaB, partial [Bacteroidales bacterium]|nr:tRNA (N(6)-L-threonylcarbamoyladenosine(37)-C(2))-methylthiotransferase MtaB [Bacteroidales bacterium]
REVYTDRVEYIKSKLPLACIAADLITGFPTETEAHFLDTMDYLTVLPISYMHVFSYSSRENTKALELANLVSPSEKKHRSEQLHLLSDRKKRDFYNLCHGTQQEVLFEAQNQGGWMSGWTGNYIKVVAPFDENLINTIHKVELNQLNLEGNFIFNP